jgi:hypothetical protein
MNKNKFSDVLDEYLDERDRQNSDYYDNRALSDRVNGRQRMMDLSRELDDMINGVEE